MLQKSGAPLETGPLYLVLLPTNLKSTVGQYRGGGGGGSRQESGIADGSVETVRESQGGSERTVIRADRLVGRLVQVEVPAYLREDVSAHGFWKRGTTTMFDIQIVNLGAGSYLHMTPEKDLVKSEMEKKDLYLQACLDRIRTFTSMV